jgi:hypothetical protein
MNSPRASCAPLQNSETLFSTGRVKSMRDRVPSRWKKLRRRADIHDTTIRSSQATRQRDKELTRAKLLAAEAAPRFRSLR